MVQGLRYIFNLKDCWSARTCRTRSRRPTRRPPGFRVL